jgi:hypothetical protein
MDDGSCRRYRDSDPDRLLVRGEEDRDLCDPTRPLRELHVSDGSRDRIFIQDGPKALDSQLRGPLFLGAGWMCHRMI